MNWTKEFRIGNLVRHTLGVARITALDGHVVTAETICDPHWHVRISNNDNLIPITPDLLEKIEGCVKEDYPFETDDFCYRKGDVFLISWDNDEQTYVNLIHKPVLYLHQLQNLYFAMTGEELTLNVCAVGV